MDVKEILEKFYQKCDTGDLKYVFTQYMNRIGAKSLDRRYKDTSNTYMIDGESYNWNKVTCENYKNNNDYMEYGKFDICLVMRKRMGNYFLIQIGDEYGNIKRPYEISYDKIIHCDEELLEKTVNEHQELFKIIERYIS